MVLRLTHISMSVHHAIVFSGPQKYAILCFLYELREGCKSFAVPSESSCLRRCSKSIGFLQDNSDVPVLEKGGLHSILPTRSYLGHDIQCSFFFPPSFFYLQVIHEFVRIAISFIKSGTNPKVYSAAASTCC